MHLWVNVHKNEVGVLNVCIDTDAVEIYGDPVQYGFCHEGITRRKEIDGFELQVIGMNDLKIGEIWTINGEEKCIDSFEFATGLVSFLDGTQLSITECVI